MSNAIFYSSNIHFCNFSRSVMNAFLAGVCIGSFRQMRRVSEWSGGVKGMKVKPR